ncbi:glycosyltransferase family 25 protein [Rhizobium sp. 2YAF20]|uniref:glycosyltransferase family 25 protein n=1 Tax=Rhizobium sp. 2YAF20 TaxID=3233027 RepID=UPI003F99CCA1
MSTVPVTTNSQTIAAKVISLSGSFRRRDAVSANLEGAKSLNWEFFDAATSERPVALTIEPKRQLAKCGRILSNAEIGCFKSHFEVLKQFVERSQHRWLLVLEDDVWVDPEFDFHLLTKELENRQIDCLRLFARRIKRADVIGYFGEQQVVRFRSDPYGTQAYVISREGATRFLATIKAIDMPIDVELGRFWNHGLAIYAIFPFPCVERAFTSTILQDREHSKGAVQTSSLQHYIFRIENKFHKEMANLLFLWSRLWKRAEC